MASKCVIVDGKTVGLIVSPEIHER